jgi:hypothetical protein
MLLTMLVKSLYKTCHSPNQRTKEFSQPLGWEEQKNHFGGFFVAELILLCATILFIINHKQFY